MLDEEVTLKARYRIKRQDSTHHVSHYVKSLNPPTASVETPERLEPTNPVPEFMESLGLSQVSSPHRVERDLIHGEQLKMWDGKKLTFFLFRDASLKSPFNGGHYPAPTIRVPRGSIYHAKTHGHGPPPHTIHWHGIEPTPMNDGVGHCSFELGTYTYQWQPNFIGTYFYHCHRNTVQHFEFGLFGGLLIEPPDAFETGPGKNPGGYPRRTAANLGNFPHIPGFKAGTLESGDPHAMTVPYDVEAFWVLDDIDSVWMTKMRNSRASLPQIGSSPGVNDRFTKADFHDFRPDYFFVTGQGFPGRRFSSAAIKPEITIPAAINSGVTGMQVSIQAKTNQTILVRVLCAAYSKVKVKFPLNGIVIAYDGRALGVPPFGNYSEAYALLSGEEIELGTAMRFDILLRSDRPINSFGEVRFYGHGSLEKTFTGKIPIQIQ